jgi:membrane-bound lytic murein transglycosylase B
MTAGVASGHRSTDAQEPVTKPPVAAPQPFDQWLAELQEEARGRGFSMALIEEALGGLEPLPRVIQADRTQAELTLGFSRYLSTRLTRAMVQRGRHLSRQYGSLLGRVERRFGVPRRFVLAVWGIETRYGRVTGTTPVFRALATLAWEPRRADFFRGQLFDALTMVQRGHIEAKTMTGSWAGAMGHPQFLPSSYLQYAVDFDGDGRRDIWRSTPDALASIANYLKGHGWVEGETWGREVHVPHAAAGRIAEVPRRSQGCFAMRNMTERRPLDHWHLLNLRRADGGPLPGVALEAGLVDVGERQFLVYPNYDALLGYNCAHYYALTVALLADALR